MATASALITFRYLTRFRCIADACEDTCCGNWLVGVDDQTRARLEALATSRAEPLSRSIVKMQLGDKQSWAMNRAENGNCIMLDETRLCRLQRDHGAEYLPNICAMFPRRANLVLEQIEVTATVACPEIARLMLLAEDSLEVDPIEADQVPRRVGTAQLGSDEKDPYRAHFLRVRNALLHILERKEHSVDCRLFFIAYLGASIHPVYREGGEDFDLKELEHQIGLILNPESQQFLAEKFAEIPPDPEIGHVVLEMIRELSKNDKAPRFHQVLAPALDGSEDPDGISVRLAGGEVRISWRKMAELQAQRRQRLTPAAAARLDGAVLRYLTNLNIQTWFIESSDLFIHHQTLLIRIAFLRFLVLGQPGVLEPDAGEALDRAIVHVFSAVTRAIDNNNVVGPALADSIRKMGTSGTIHAAKLLKF